MFSIQEQCTWILPSVYYLYHVLNFGLGKTCINFIPPSSQPGKQAHRALHHQCYRDHPDLHRHYRDVCGAAVQCARLREGLRDGAHLDGPPGSSESPSPDFVHGQDWKRVAAGVSEDPGPRWLRLDLGKWIHGVPSPSIAHRDHASTSLSEPFVTFNMPN